jgi:endogenous inhibitor of DNA gyrase (YacG/DUF329 family)
MGNKLKVKCPICKKLTQWEGNPYRPFCSKECKLADLYGWLNEEYSIKETNLSFDTPEIPDKKPWNKEG